MTRRFFLSLLPMLGLTKPAKCDSAPKLPENICVDRAPKSWLVKNPDYEVISRAYRDTGWQWGWPGFYPSAETIAESVKEQREHADKMRTTISSGGLTIHQGELYLHERIYFGQKDMEDRSLVR